MPRAITWCKTPGAFNRACLTIQHTYLKLYKLAMSPMSLLIYNNQFVTCIIDKHLVTHLVFNMHRYF